MHRHDNEPRSTFLPFSPKSILIFIKSSQKTTEQLPRQQQTLISIEQDKISANRRNQSLIIAAESALQHCAAVGLEGVLDRHLRRGNVSNKKISDQQHSEASRTHESLSCQRPPYQTVRLRNRVKLPPPVQNPREKLEECPRGYAAGQK